MATINLLLTMLALGNVGLGSWGICWARGDHASERTRWGRLLVWCSLILFGTGALVAALLRSDALAPLGLLAGLLVVAATWESRPENGPAV